MSPSQKIVEKFAAYRAQNNDYLFFVGVASGWVQIHQMEADQFIGADFERYSAREVISWLVAYPSTGEIVEGDGIFAPLPPGVSGSIQSTSVEIPHFTAEDLRTGENTVQINFAPSPTHPGNPHFYATSLTNVPKEKIRCLGFAAYQRKGDIFRLATVTNRPFSSQQFAEWYAVKTSGWVEPGETVCDPTNYGSVEYWVYYFQTESNGQSHAGRKTPAPGVITSIVSRLFRIGKRK